jgi:beta-1,4-mannosyl-glycoprotein beta-1,4-N-acetylglucosaminyltransferase
MAITEAISLYNELDLLEAHLEESQHWADRIIIMESPVTFSSLPKPLYFEENKERFSRFNVEHIITPPDIFEEIPLSYPDAEKSHWAKARRRNRDVNRQFNWDELRRGTDYVYLNDVDEFISRTHWPLLEDLLKDNHYHYLVPTVRKFNYFVNLRGSKGRNYRITRADITEMYPKKGVPRTTTKEIGWHFTNCLNPQEMHNKLRGICCQFGIKPSEVPSVEYIEECFRIDVDPIFRRSLSAEIPESMPLDDLSWAPKFMQDNIELYPWHSLVRPRNPSWRLK